jgi:L-erythro-3,5-diaminohexanoate dehydrogenase
MGMFKFNKLVIPIASMSSIPLYISKITSIKNDTVEIKGIAVINFSCILVEVPKDLEPEIALAALDISRVIPLIRRALKRLKDKKQITCLVIGCGRSGLTSIVYCKYFFIMLFLVKKLIPEIQILAIDLNDEHINVAKKFLNEDDVIEKIDAQDVFSVLNFVRNYTKEGVDLVLNCVNTENVEASSMISGKIFLS